MSDRRIATFTTPAAALGRGIRRELAARRPAHPFSSGFELVVADGVPRTGRGERRDGGTYLGRRGERAPHLPPKLHRRLRSAAPPYIRATLTRTHQRAHFYPHPPPCLTPKLTHTTTNPHWSSARRRFLMRRRPRERLKNSLSSSSSWYVLASMPLQLRRRQALPSTLRDSPRPD